MRVWIGTGTGAPQWACRVECIQTGEKDRRFNDPEELLAYLRASLLEDAGLVVQRVPAPGDDASAAPVDPRGPAP
jgi:hypothetical protein